KAKATKAKATKAKATKAKATKAKATKAKATKAKATKAKATKAKATKAKAAKAKLFRFEGSAEPRARYGERINAWPCWGRAPSRASAMREPFAPPVEVRWTRKLSAPAATSPAVGGDGVLYVADGDGRLEAYDVETGEPRYTLQTDPVREASPAWPLVAQGLVPIDRVPVSSTPAVSHNHVLFGDAEGIFYCVRRGVGEVLWRKASSLSMAGRGGVAYPAPLIFDDHVFAADADGNLYAAATRNGRPAFRTSVRGRPTAPLALAASRALILLACDPLFPGEPRELLALDAWQGDPRWKLELPGRVHAVACGRDFALCAGDGGLSAVRLDDGVLAWSLDAPRGLALSLAGSRGFVGTPEGVVGVDLGAGEVLWDQALGAVHGVACAGEVVWAAGVEGLMALEAASGKVLAKPRLPGAPVGQPVFAAGLLVVATDARELRAFAPRG
ncbi:MAG: PQQ-binding-like beta-propeller repeat protein, partial [Planctomycetes bacterium]|nr:PQQ-binding-like beta-propeller repeat protein [Planctomycetota bacterium]